MDIKDRDMEDQELSSIVTLIDDTGAEVEFDHLMTFDHADKHYVALLPLDPIEGVGEDEIVLLEIKEDGDEDIYVAIEDDDLLEAVFETFQRLLDEELDDGDDA